MIEDASATHRIVADFAVAHIAITGHAHGASMCPELREERVVPQPIHVGRRRLANQIAFRVFAQADPIENGKDHGPFDRRIRSKRFQRLHGLLRALRRPQRTALCLGARP